MAAVQPLSPRDDELYDAYSSAVMRVVDQVGPAVVNLAVRAAPPDGARRPRRRPIGAGSGVLIAPDGYLLTNSHVVAHGGAVSVALEDGSEQPARIVGDDPATDLALLHIEGSGLPFAALDPERRARPGQLAIAMGNPLGFSSTVSTGVVSAAGRALRARNGQLIDDVVQHTAPLNPGSSGGPLLDSHGRLLGINTAIIAGSQGIGFAVPATTAAWVVSEVLARGRVRRAWLGIGGQTRPLSRRRARHFDLSQAAGVEVVSLERDAPAARAGLRERDLIVAFDGHPVTSIDDLHRLLRRHPPDQAQLRILRGTGALDIAVHPVER